ncbi:hypothetical protein LH991_01080 [Schleiferilactobacillus harbinensis]|uniref:hypothetical protein n=1 Tax=Schleiferilactobacillus harbinensis TaxID=304207 RepID=UPI00047F98FD|nr:hypothetical protein [Schleiferilactobacillus harbinensis]QFR62681.1 hypothetical protein LH991_01080 [Schleiferilactobacillus harbinensis]
MATYNFTVRYYGKALDAHRIPVRDLAPSLLALSEAFQEIQHIQNPTEPDLSLDIQASDNGSFLVDLILANGPDLLNRAMNLLNSQPSTALINLSGYVALFIDAVQLIKKLARVCLKIT